MRPDETGEPGKMNFKAKSLSCSILLLLVGCTQNMHGSFTPSTFRLDQGPVVELGKVEGRSCQTRVLYVLPKGERATTDLAVQNAKSQIERTEFLADMSIDDEVYFGMGYSRRCIVVAATAYGQKRSSRRAQ